MCFFGTFIFSNIALFRFLLFMLPTALLSFNTITNNLEQCVCLLLSCIHRLYSYVCCVQCELYCEGPVYVVCSVSCIVKALCMLCAV